MSETCKTCRWWDDSRGWFTPEFDHREAKTVEYRVGICRIRAPGPGGFTNTRDYDWCGEHRPSHPKDTPHE